MNGYKVVTSDGQKVGQVVDEAGENVIVEMGHIRKVKHAIPKVFTVANDADESVCITVTKDIVEGSPTVNGGVDEESIARHYGLATELEPLATEPEPDDPEHWDLAAGAAERERVDTLEDESPTDQLTGRGHDPAAPPGRKEPRS
jgi:hypothetical protein